MNEHYHDCVIPKPKTRWKATMGYAREIHEYIHSHFLYRISKHQEVSVHRRQSYRMISRTHPAAIMKIYVQIAISMSLLILKRRSQLSKESLSFDEVPLHPPQVSYLPHYQTKEKRKKKPYLQNPSQKRHSIPLHPILEISSKPHPNLLQLGISRPSSNRHLDLLLHHIDEPHFFHPRSSSVGSAVTLSDLVTSFKDQFAPSIEWRAWRDGPVFGRGVRSDFVVFEPAAGFYGSLSVLEEWFLEDRRWRWDEKGRRGKNIKGKYLKAWR